MLGDKFDVDHDALQHRSVLTAPSQAAPPLSIVVIYGNQLYGDCLSTSIGAAIGGNISTFSRSADWLEKDQTDDPLVLLCTSGISREREAAELDALLHRQTCPRIIVVGDSEAPQDVVSVLNKGVRGYIPTSLVLNIAVEAIRLVFAGGVFFPANALLQAQRTPPSNEAKGGRPIDSFTPKQIAVIEMIRKGKANKTIAYELNMCESTVKVHVRNIMKKLRARNRTQVAFYANQMMSESLS